MIVRSGYYKQATPPGLQDHRYGNPFLVGNEIIRLEDAHEAGELVRERARSRMPAKSRFVNGVVGLSADSNSQASNSGIEVKAIR